MRFKAGERVEAEPSADAVEKRGKAGTGPKAPIPTFPR
jgi:hypothetical protein